MRIGRHGWSGVRREQACPEHSTRSRTGRAYVRIRTWTKQRANKGGRQGPRLAHKARLPATFLATFRSPFSVRRLLFSTVPPQIPVFPLFKTASRPDHTQRPDGVDPQTDTRLFGSTALFSSRENPTASALRLLASPAPLLTCSCPLSRRGLLRLTLLPFKVCPSAFSPCHTSYPSTSLHSFPTTQPGSARRWTAHHPTPPLVVTFCF